MFYMFVLYWYKVMIPYKNISMKNIAYVKYTLKNQLFIKNSETLILNNVDQMRKHLVLVTCKLQPSWLHDFADQ